MKYGLLVYKETDNIGDDIQAYAAEKFLPQIDYFIDRESLNTFRPENDEKVAVIMNAWYMHNKYNWPPSPYILPGFLSVHICNTDLFMVEEDFFSPFNIEYFKQYAPIGTRDSSTLQVLQAHGIDGFFSACMTLTIEPEENVQKEKKIYCVDVEEDVIDKIRIQASSCQVISITHNMTNEESKFCWAERRKKVQELLFKYQKAQCVVTTRLHCALPCLALGTPVLLLCSDKVEFKNRVDDYLPMLHCCLKSEFMEGDRFDVVNPPPNKNLHIALKEKLIQKVHNFLKKAKGLESTAEIPENYWYHQLLRQSEILKKQLPKLYNVHEHAWENRQAKLYFESQMEQKDLRIKELESWIAELGQTKQYLESQLTTKDLRITELGNWVAQLEEVKEYLKKQVECKNSRIVELEDWAAQLEEAKGYLEKQVEYKDLRISELESWTRELEEAKKYLEKQKQNYDNQNPI